MSRDTTILDPILALPGTDPPDIISDKLTCFRAQLMLHLGTVALVWSFKDGPLEIGIGWRLVVAAGIFACFGLSWKPGWTRTAAVCAAALVLFQVVVRLPVTSNHGFLGLLCIAAVASLGDDETEHQALALSALRWMFIIVLVWAGLQKLLYGTYFNGSFLAYKIATEARFELVFAPLLGAEEILRLGALSTTRIGSGPFELSAPLGLVLSNAVWILEIGLPLLLLSKATRQIGVVLIAALLVGIELGARELLFGGLFLQLAALFWPGNLNRRLWPILIAFYPISAALVIGGVVQ